MRFREIRDTIDRTASGLADTAADTRAAVVGAAVLGVIALAVALIALGAALKARTA